MTDRTPTSVAGDERSEVFDATRQDGVLELHREDAVWLSTGWRGGTRRADAAYNVTVPEGWSCDDVAPFVRERLADAGFEDTGLEDGGFDALAVDAAEEAADDARDPTSAAADDARGTTSAPADGPGAEPPVLLTGVSMEHARGARLGPVEAYATVGVSNPAALPTNTSELDAPGDASNLPDGELVAGTANVVVGTTRSLAPGALANLVAIATEARATTLLDAVGVPGTTSDAVVVASDPTGDHVAYSGSATRVGAATRACVREALTAALHARYDTTPRDFADGTPPSLPDDVEDARYGVSTTARARVLEP